MKIPAKLIHEIAQELDCGMKVYLNIDTLEIKSILDWDDMDISPWQEDLDEIDKEWTNFAVFTQMETWEAFKVMEGFIGEVEDERFCEGLVRILNRKSPFANFKIEVESSIYRQNWFDFKQKKYEDYVIENLEYEGFEIEKNIVNPKFMNDSKKIIDFIEVQIKSFVEDMRPPKEIRDQLDIGYKYDKSTLEIFEIRPHYKLKDKIIHSNFAKAKFIKTQNRWKVYWMRASGKWERYEPHPEVDHIKDFFTLVDEDKYHCFKG